MGRRPVGTRDGRRHVRAGTQQGRLLDRFRNLCRLHWSDEHRLAPACAPIPVVGDGCPRSDWPGRLVTCRILDAQIRTSRLRAVQILARPTPRTANGPDQFADPAERRVHFSAGIRTRGNPCEQMDRRLAHRWSRRRLSGVRVVPPWNSPLARQVQMAQGAQTMACHPPPTWRCRVLRSDKQVLGRCLWHRAEGLATHRAVLRRRSEQSELKAWAPSNAEDRRRDVIHESGSRRRSSHKGYAERR